MVILDCILVLLLFCRIDNLTVLIFYEMGAHCQNRIHISKRAEQLVVAVCSIRHRRIIMENEWNLIPLVAIAVHIIFFKCLQCIIILINGLWDRESQLIQPLLVDVEQA